MKHNVKNKYSNDMKVETYKLFLDVEQGNLTPEEAQTKLLNLFNVSQRSKLLMSFIDELIDDISDNNPQLAELRRKRLKELINCG